jgi:integrase
MIINLKTIVPDGLTCPEGKRRVEYVDKGGTGLYCEVRATSPGQGTYYLRWKQGGKTQHQKLGTTIEISLDEARLRAKKLKAEITLGKDPRSDREATKAVPTLDAFFRDHYLPYCKVHNRGWKKKSQMFDLRVKSAFGSKRLDQIMRHDTTAWHVGLREDGLSPAYADRFLALLRHILAKSVEFNMLEKSPAAGIKMFNPDNRVEHYLDDDELKRLMKVLQTDKNRTVCMIAIFLLSTGARLNEALQAKWVDISRQNKMWQIPAETAKGKRHHTIALNSTACSVLDHLTSEGTYEYLFINRKTGKPYVTIHKVWARLRNNAELPHLRIHDLRHMHASFLVNSGRTLFDVQVALGHRQVQTSFRYARLSSKTQAESALCVDDAINAAMPESP